MQVITIAASFGKRRGVRTASPAAATHSVRRVSVAVIEGKGSVGRRGSDARWGKRGESLSQYLTWERALPPSSEFQARVGEGTGRVEPEGDPC